MKAFFFFFLLILMGCHQYGILVSQRNLDRSYLASAHIGSPDPSSSPNGQMLIAEWWITKDLLQQKPQIEIEMIFHNLTRKTVVFPVTSRFGYVTYPLIQNEFKTTQGFLSYRAQIFIEEEGKKQPFYSWDHQLWVQFIQLEEPKPSVSKR